jgi:diguanylate cyclase (GGDEF)-like protein
MSDQFFCLEAGQLDRFLDRRRALSSLVAEPQLEPHLLEVLRRANDFVPSAAGSILLDDPTAKGHDRTRNRLTFVAAFGDKAADLVGQAIPGSTGIAGHVYQTKEPYRSGDARRDRHFYARLDETIDYRTETVLAVPIVLEHEVCGVLELLNRQHSVEHDGADAAPGDHTFSERDLSLLTVFAGYIAISIQNILDGRRAHEIARRDNLTGLFNDRFLHPGLEGLLSRCRETGADLSLLFLDLDYFKRVNDTHGHLAGSQTLRDVGELITRELKAERSTNFAARYGGDEFVIAVAGKSLAAGVHLAEKLRTLVADTTYCRGGGSILADPLNLTGLTCSIGVASLRQHVSPELSSEQAKSALLRLADSAMYVAKETGRNQTAVAGKPVPRGAAARPRRRA